MKYSGVEWIGEIPDKWNLVRLKDICINKKEVAGEKSSEYERLALTLNGVIKRPKDDQEGLQPKEFDTYQILEENDFVFKMIDLQNISTSRVGLSPYTGLVSPAYIRFASKKKGQFNEFIHYYLLSLWHNCVYNNIAGDGVRSALNATDMGNLKCPYPTEDQQLKIAGFLNKKTAEIDSLIEIENQQIEKIKEYKQAVITEAVTRGLDKKVPLKDSGVEWIGKIPEGWSIQKVLYQLSMPVTDGPHTTPELQPEGVAFVSAEAVSCGNGGIDFSHIRGYITEEFYQECCLKYIPEIDDVYMIKSGATTGRVSIVTTLEPKFTIWSPLAVMRCDKNKMVPKFLYYAVQSEQFQRQVALGWSFGTQQNLGMRTLEQLKLIIPTLSEQKDIANYLDMKIGDIEKAIKVKNEKIERLDEYKKSIIYEYVTGKKEVC